MTILRTLLIDDEKIARQVLREELELMENIDLVGESENGEQALVHITEKKPDLIFLDIQMPGMGGFELLQHLTGGHMPVVVMVTAYDQYAIRAFEAGAIDYLLKPVSRERLVQAVKRAHRLHGNPLAVVENVARLQEMGPVAKPGERRLSKVIGKLKEEYFLLNLEEVIAFQATGDLVWIITSKGRYTAVHNLKTIAHRLQDSSFRRVHRNALVNVDQIRKMSMITSQRWLITLNNGEQLTVSKRQAKNVRDILRL